jgi:putative transcriptional regulator
MNTEKPFHSLKDHFLIAMPSLNDSEFGHSIAYICEHTEQGAMGIVLNHPTSLQLDEILAHLEIEDIRSPHPDRIIAGGPVQTDRGFVLHRSDQQDWDSTLHITEQISLTTSQDILKAMAHNQGPTERLVALGYAGWSAGQLEQEIAENAWLTTPADSDIIFNTPFEEKANAAAAKLGIDLNLISPEAGHA